MISPEDHADFESVIEEHDFSLDDFELTEIHNNTSSEGEQTLTGAISVKRTATGVEKRYMGGRISAWPSQFAEDLKGGAFD